MVVDVDARLARYEVTTAPGRRRLQLVWVRPPDVELTATDGGAAPAAEGLAVLDAYRITRVPEHHHRAAS